MLHGLAAQLHLARLAVEPRLHAFEDVIAFPSSDTTLLASLAVALQRTNLADIGPIEQQSNGRLIRTQRHDDQCRLLHGECIARLPDIPRHDAPQPDEARHTLTVRVVERMLTEVCVQRSHRHVLCLCQFSILNAVKFRGNPSGDAQ